MSVNVSIHSLTNCSGYICNDYFSQFIRETLNPLLPDHLFYFSSGPFTGFPNFSANADCSINTAG